MNDKTIIHGVLDLGDLKQETADVVAKRVRNAPNYVSPERLILAPDCAIKYLQRDVMMDKLCVLVQGTAIVNRELGRA